VIGVAFANQRGHGEFGDVDIFFLGSLHQTVFNFLSNDMFAKGGYKMLNSAGDKYAIGVG
jgi:hypothetical protein